MASAFDSALVRVLRFEGGFINHPSDRGGATNKGITQATYDSYRMRMHRHLQSVEHISSEDVRSIYHDMYWAPGKCIAIESAKRPLLAMAHFDSCVNHGVGNAALILQRALGVNDDGAIGPVTMEALKNCDEAATVANQLDQRTLFFARIVKRTPGQSVFIEGWISRVISLRNELIQPTARAA